MYLIKENKIRSINFESNFNDFNKKVYCIHEMPIGKIFYISNDILSVSTDQIK